MLIFELDYQLFIVWYARDVIEKFVVVDGIRSQEFFREFVHAEHHDEVAQGNGV